MSNKNSSDPSKSLGLEEITTIRDILMGKQMEDYDRRFSQFSDETEAFKTDVNSRFEQMEQSIQQQLDEMKRESAERFDKLESLLTSSVEKLNSRLDDTSKNDKAQLGEMLKSLGDSLIKK